MREMKNSGIKWVGEIPSHWVTRRAKNMFSKEKREVRDSDEVITCFRDGQVTLRKNRRTSGFTESLTEIGYQGIRKGDLVIHQMDAFAGAIGVSDSDGKGTSVYHCCTPKGDIDVYYYSLLIRRMANSGFIQSLYRGIRERSSDFNFSVFGVQYLPVPPLSEQKAIAEFLDKKCGEIDELVGIEEHIIAELQAYKQAIITDTVTKGIDSKVEMKDCGIRWLGTIPKHWIVEKIKSYFILHQGNGFKVDLQGLKDGDFPFCKASDINGEEAYVSKANNYVDKTTVYEEKYNIIPKNSILFSKIGEALKKNHRKINIVPCIVDNNCAALVPKKRLNIKYFYYVSKCINMEWFVNEGAVPCVNSQKLMLSKIPIPPLPEQQAIAEYLDKRCEEIDSLIAVKQLKIAELKDYKKSVIYEYVTGKKEII